MAMRSCSSLEHASSKIRAQFLEWNTLHDYESFLDFQNELLQLFRLEECNVMTSHSSVKYSIHRPSILPRLPQKAVCVIRPSTLPRLPQKALCVVLLTE